MIFFGVLLLLVGAGVMIYCAYIGFRDLIKPLYEEIYLQKKYKRNLFDKVQWIATKSFEDSNSYIIVRDNLFEYIEQAQFSLNVEENFCIDFSNEQEKDFICKILDIHKQNIIDSFFRNSLTKHKDYYNLNNLEYYMFHLMNFLEKNERRDKFNEKVLYEFFHKDEVYRTYKLTDYGISYQKLYYITFLFCANNEKTKLLLDNANHTLNGIKKIIETREIQYWS